MKESYGKGLATHTDPESCGVVCKGGVEALTGARGGRVFSRESPFLRDADAVGESGRPHQGHRYREMLLGPARSETPCTYGYTSRGSREVPCPPAADGFAGRVGKSKDVRRR
jgi:RNA-directed DNA polymerase